MLERDSCENCGNELDHFGYCYFCDYDPYDYSEEYEEEDLEVYVARYLEY